MDNSGKDYQVYVLRNPAGTHYIGLSTDPRLRLQQHNAGVSLWTRNRGPWQLVWLSRNLSLTEARRLENYLKRQKGGSGFYAFTGLSGMSGS